MSNTISMTPYTKVKQSTDRDSRNFGPLVSGYELQTSTLNQTSITLTQFVCSLDKKSSILLVIDGQILTEGVGNDYVWVTGVNGTASVITLAVAIPAGLNIQIYKIGSSNPATPNAETIQATANFALSQVDQKNNNKIINGSFDFWQRGTSFAAIGANAYSADRFAYGKVGAMIHTISRSTDVPTSSSSIYSMLVDCTTVDTSIATTDYCVVANKLEGTTLRTFKNKNMVLAFWVKSTKTGTFCIGLQNSAASRSLVKEYTVNATNTWERKVIRFTHDSTGTWLYDTGIGLAVYFTLACGTTYQTTADTWQTGNYVATANQVNACDSTANDFYLSDIVLVEDNAASNKVPDFCLAGDSVAEELLMCQRYFEKSYLIDIPLGTATSSGSTTSRASGGNVNASSFFKVTKRVSAAATIYNPVTGGTASIRNSSAGSNLAATVFVSGDSCISMDATAATDGNLYSWHWAADAEL